LLIVLWILPRSSCQSRQVSRRGWGLTAEESIVADHPSLFQQSMETVLAVSHGKNSGSYDVEGIASIVGDQLGALDYTAVSTGRQLASVD
jgi:hypothetical protein